MSEDLPSRLKAPHVWLDACAYRTLGFDWDGRWLAGIADLAKRGLIRVVLTDITKREVRGLMRESIAKARTAVTQSAVVMRQVGMKDLVAKLDDEAACIAAMDAAFDKWLKQCKAVTLKAEIDVGALLDDYFERRPPFGPGGRKAEFPDAVAVATIRYWITKFKSSTYVVSDDKGVRECCAPDGPFFLTSSVKEVLSHAAASVAIHEAIRKAVTETDWLAEHLDGDLTGTIEIRNGMRRGGGVISIDVKSATVNEHEVQEVLIDEMVGNNVTCTLWIWIVVETDVYVCQDPYQTGPDDWDPGWHHSQHIYPRITTTATLLASVQDDGSVNMMQAYFDDSKITVEFEDIVRDLD
jgi:hypothetical protein